MKESPAGARTVLGKEPSFLTQPQFSPEHQHDFNITLDPITLQHFQWILKTLESIPALRHGE